MADPKGVYYGPQETGLATILPREYQGDFLDYVSADKAAKLKYAQEQQKAKAEAIKNFKPEDVGRFHRESVNKFLQETIDGYASGTIDDYEAQKRLVEYSTYAANSMNIEKDWDTAMKTYESDDRVNAANAQAMLQQQYLGDGGIDSAKKLSTEPLNPNFFLEEKGGSAAINEDKAVQQVVSNNFDDLTESAFMKDAGTWQRVGLGVKVRDEIARREKLTAIAKVDANDKIVVKSGEELVDDGIVEAFMADPYMRRILLDRVDKDNPTPTELGNVLSEILKPRVKGTVEEIRKTNYVKENSPFGYGLDDAELGRFLAEKVVALKEGRGYDQAAQPGLTFLGRTQLPPDATIEPRPEEDFVFIGKQSGNKTLNGVKFINGQAMAEVATFDKEMQETKAQLVPLNANLVRNFYPAGVSAEFEKQLKKMGVVMDGNIVPNPDRFVTGSSQSFNDIIFEE